MQIPIKRTIERITGGLMIVPMIIGSVIITLSPHTAVFFGSFTKALFTGSLSILAVFYVCMGATIDVRSLPGVARRGGLLMAAKILLGIAAALLLGHFLGTQTVKGGWF